MNKNNQGEDIADYVNQSQEVRYTSKPNKLKQKISDFYREACKFSTVFGATAAVYANSSSISNFVGGYTGRDDIIFNVGLDDVAITSLILSTAYVSNLIAKKYNPLEKAINSAGKLSYNLSKLGIKSAYNASKFFVDGTRDFVGEIIVAPLSQKLRSKITTKETYESNMEREEQILEHRRNKALKKADNLQSKINKLQKLKMNYQDNIVENPEIYRGKIEDANEKLKNLYEQKNSLNPDAI
jgi:hypothetical protein